MHSETDEPYRLINREMGWLAFNRRVLDEAAHPDNPPLERMKFLSIASSNLDEFFMVRYASLRARMLAGDETPDPAGLAPREQLRLIADDAKRFVEEQTLLWHNNVRPALAKAGLLFVCLRDATDEQKRWAESLFKRDILPKLTVSVREKKKALPPAAGRLLQIGIWLLGAKKEEPVFATAPVPAQCKRAYKMPEAIGGGMLLVEDIIAMFVGQLVPGRRVLGCWPYRVTRDADFTVPDDATGDLVTETKKSLSRRKTGDVVRLEVDAGAPDGFVDCLRAMFSLHRQTVYQIDGPLRLTFLLRELYGMRGMDEHRYPPFVGRVPGRLLERSVFDVLRAGDVFLHHPYDSFDAVLRFVCEAAADPRVLAIKQTLYRVSGDSPVIKALCGAAEAGKRVTVLLEVKARFDEENNIHWGELLQRAGCEVIYGLPRVKTHSKITLVVRREADGLRRYVHLGTGNYNDVTARQYTDMGLLTCDTVLGRDAQAFFNMVTGFSREPKMGKLIYAPGMLRQSLIDLIGREAENARAGLPSGITAKMNSLVDPQIIQMLYEASRAGVRVRLLVRGVCCLIAGVPGLSENIQVRSIIGRFLEHSRVFRFENGGEPLLFLSSADWMPRNLNRRVELMFPIDDERVRRRVEEVLDTQWRDNVKAWEMAPDGTYSRVPASAGAVRMNAQEWMFHARAPKGEQASDEAPAMGMDQNKGEGDEQVDAEPADGGR